MNAITSVDDNGTKLELHAVGVLVNSDTFDEWSKCLQTAVQLSAIKKDARSIVLRQIADQEAKAGSTNSNQINSGLISEKPEQFDFNGFLREVFTFPPIDRDRLRCEACMRTDNEEMLHVAVGMISPLTQFRLLGAGFIKEGRFIGEGKDAIVHAVKSHPEWVVKILKAGGVERAGVIEHYSNILAAEAELRVPVVTHLGDGRLLQRFIAGEATANKLYAIESLAAQQKADYLADKARQLLGLESGQMLVTKEPWKVGIDPSYANFHFDANGNLTGWIDPLFSISR
jgi:hypothetical protein